MDSSSSPNKVAANFAKKPFFFLGFFFSSSAFSFVPVAALPDDFDYRTIKGLRLEAQEKLNKIKPLSIGQASRISGVSPADISVLLIWLAQNK